MHIVPQNSPQGQIELYPLFGGRFVVARQDESVKTVLDRINEALAWIPFRGEPAQGPEPGSARQEVL